MSKEEAELQEKLLEYQRASRSHKLSVDAIRRQEKMLEEKRVGHMKLIHDECEPAIYALQMMIRNLRTKEAEEAAKALLAAQSEFPLAA